MGYTHLYHLSNTSQLVPIGVAAILARNVFQVHQEHEMLQYIDLIKVQIKNLSSDSEALPGINPLMSTSP